MSLKQMQRLNFKFDLCEEGAYLTCNAMEYRRRLLPFSRSGHLIVDLSHIRNTVDNKCFASTVVFDGCEPDNTDNPLMTQD